MRKSCPEERRHEVGAISAFMSCVLDSEIDVKDAGAEKK